MPLPETPHNFKYCPHIGFCSQWCASLIIDSIGGAKTGWRSLASTREVSGTQGGFSGCVAVLESAGVARALDPELQEHVDSPKDVEAQRLPGS